MEAVPEKFPGRSAFETGYSFKPPVSGMQGDIKGAFSNLKVLDGIVVDPSKDNEVITRSSNGMFF